jgi:transposase-like protein
MLAQKTITELAQLYHVNPNLIAKWKKQALAGLPEIFRQPNNAGRPIRADSVHPKAAGDLRPPALLPTSVR